MDRGKIEITGEIILFNKLTSMMLTKCTVLLLSFPELRTRLSIIKSPKILSYGCHSNVTCFIYIQECHLFISKIFCTNIYILYKFIPSPMGRVCLKDTVSRSIFIVFFISFHFCFKIYWVKLENVAYLH